MPAVSWLEYLNSNAWMPGSYMERKRQSELQNRCLKHSHAARLCAQGGDLCPERVSLRHDRMKSRCKAARRSAASAAARAAAALSASISTSWSPTFCGSTTSSALSSCG